MNVKTRLQISAALPVLLAVITAVILYGVSSHVRDIVPKLAAANSITKAASALDQATFTYLLVPGEHERAAWVEAHKELNGYLAEEPYLTAQDRNILKDLQARHAETTSLFHTLSEHVTVTSKNGGMVNDEQTRELLGKILDTTRTIIGGAQVLASNAHDEAVHLQESAYFSIIAVSAVLAGILAFSALFLIQRVTGGITMLHTGMSRIASSGLEHRMTPDGRDEITELANGFNRMATELGVARENLKNEMAEKEQTAQSLRKSNIELSSAMEKLTRAQQDMVNRERAEALRQISRGVVHDINNALMPVTGFSELYVNYPDQLRETSDVREAFMSIRESATRITKVVRNMASFCEPAKQVGKTRVELGGLIQEVVAATEPMWKAQKQAEGISISVETKVEEVPAFDADRVDLVDALRALMMNAIEAMPQGGVITLRGGKAAGMAIVEVSDTGEGMDEAVRLRALEPFFSTKGRPHSGMGLTGVHGAMVRCAGDFELRSVPGKGTTATMKVPLIASTTRPVSASATSAVSRKLRVLTVDDEPWSTKILERYLALDGHRADGCSESRAALDALGKTAYDLVIVDRAMPDISGDALAREIKKLRPSVPILMLTGFGEMMAHGAAIPLGVDRVLAKPVDQKDLRDAIAALLAGRVA